MKNSAKIASLAFSIVLVACTTLNHPPPTLGMSEEQLIAKSGKPTAIHQEGEIRQFEYSSPWSQEAFMARFGRDGKLRSWEQVLTTERFARVRIGETTKRQVSLTFGQPAETTYLSLSKLEVWSYRYKEDGVKNSMMHIHFDQTGVVRMMQNGPDPMYETNPDRGGGRGGGRR